MILIITYGGGVYLAKSTINIHLGMFQLDLIFVGLLFYGVGRCFKRKQWETLLRKNIPIVLAVTICVLYYFGNINPITMDFPSRFFPNHFINLLTGINGSIFLMVFSLWISKVNFISNIFIYLGKNSIGIMFYHFMFFKVGFLFLHLLGIVPISYLQHFVPTDEIGRKYWCLMFANSIVFSTMLHELTKKIPIISFMLGMRKDKWNAIYYKLFDFPKEKDK